MSLYKILLRYFFPLAGLISFNSCKKFVEIPPPVDRITSATVFSDSTNATAAILGLYTAMINSSELKVGNGAISVYTGLSGDEIYDTRQIPDEMEFSANSISPSINGSLALLWADSYKLIYQANACIEGLNKSNLGPEIKNQLTGEAEFARAFLYFNLINLFGDVPLITTTDYKQSGSIARTPAGLIYNQITEDLIDAQNKLSINYITAGKIRPDKFVAGALLARVYLYKKDWAMAEQTADLIIQSGGYTLEPDLNNVFLSSASETIWQLQPVIPGIETTEGYQFIPLDQSFIPNYVITGNLLDAFESNDLRKANWLDSTVIDNAVYYYPYKYKLGADGNSEPLEYYTVLRLAEQFLIRAEAKAQQGKIEEAINDIDKIRARAGLVLIADSNPSINQQDLINLIYKERRIELFSEWGHRWFDLKRTDQVDAVLSLVKPGWQHYASLYPLPSYEIEANPALVQNTGY